MARIDYDECAAAAFQAGRQLPPAGLGQWRAAITRHLAPMAGMRILDLGAGIGMWAAALASWYDISMVAVEPSAAIRARSSCIAMIGGDAAALPLGAANMDSAWLSTVVHHLPDLPAAVRELVRVLRLGAPVLIRSAFAGRCQQIGLARYWPEAAAFKAAGFRFTALERVRQVTARSLTVLAATTRREAHTPLMLISETAYQAGLAWLQADAAIDTGPVIDILDLLVRHKPGPGAQDRHNVASRSHGSGVAR